MILRNILYLIPGMKRLSRLRYPLRFRRSAHYWEHNYARGGTSGSGSYVALAHAKAEFFSAFVVRRRAVSSRMVISRIDGWLSAPGCCGSGPASAGPRHGRSQSSMPGWKRVIGSENRRWWDADRDNR
jgi:hypothetical protein